ncbi:MAG: nuclear transport factor 2 family protein [Burkholderiales bacterium]
MDQTRLDALLQFYQTLTPESVSDFGRFYSENAYFKDPFNEVRHLADIQAIFSRMFRQIDEPRFEILERIGDQGGLFLVWDLHFRLRSWKPDQERRIHGVSHLRFDAAGKVCYHRDYWDTGEELYEKLPLLGLGARLLRRIAG